VVTARGPASARNKRDCGIGSVLDWAMVRARLEGSPDSASAVALDAWMREMINNRVLITMGEGKYHHNHLAQRMRASLDATAGA